MSEHYYTEQPTTSQKRSKIVVELRGNKIELESSSSVFSRKSVDFGTRLLIESVHLDDSQDSILDLGCGYGVIGIALALTFPSVQVTMLDINRRAVEVASDNVSRSQLQDRVIVKESNSFSGVLGQKFDLILSNPPIRIGKERLYGMWQDARSHLKPGGSLWLVIRKAQGALTAIKELERIFGQTIEVIVKKKGYLVIKSKLVLD